MTPHQRAHMAHETAPEPRKRSRSVLREVLLLARPFDMGVLHVFHHNGTNGRNGHHPTVEDDGGDA